jgi:hypothetical protein
MGLLKTDGVNDYVLFDGASAALQAVPTGASTVLTVIRRVNTSAVWNGLVTLETSAAAYKETLEINSANVLTLDSATPGGNFVGSATTGITDSTDYHLIAASHISAGATTLVNKNITSGAAVARETSGAIANGATLGAGGLVRLGMWQASDPSAVWMAVTAVWDKALTNAQIDECWANKRTSDIWNCSAGRPLFLTELNTLTPTDLGGNATFNQVNGPILDAAETAAGWTFDGLGVAVGMAYDISCFPKSIMRTGGRI